jgi:predicted MFS family arabinose efflux permease
LSTLLVPSGLALVAATYGLVRLAYGLYLPDVRDDLGLGVAGAGLVSSGASVVYCLGAVVALVQADRRPRTLLVAVGVTGGGGALAMAWAPDVATFAASTVVASAAAGMVSPTLVVVLRRHPGTAERPAAQAVVNSGTGPGLVAAAVLALLLLPGWRDAWAWSGAATLVVALAVLVAARGLGPDPSPVAGRALGLPARWWSSHAAVLAGSLLLGAASAAVWSYGRSLLVDAGTGATASVVAWMVVGVGGAAAATTARWVDRVGPRRAWVVTVGVVAVSTALLATAAGALPIALVACAAFGWGFVAATGALIAWTVAIDPDRSARGTAVLFVVLVAGQAVGSAAVGWLEGPLGQPGAFVLAAAAALLAALVPWADSRRSLRPRRTVVRVSRSCRGR